MYNRLIESELKNWARKADRKPLLLNGARQVGKTFILQKFAKENFRHLHYFNFETALTLGSIFERTLEPSDIITALSLQTGRSIDLASDILFFDEIQACPRALHSLKYFRERQPELAVCAAGSLLGVRLSKDPFPVGKVDELDLFPMNFSEFLPALGEQLVADLLLNMASQDEFPAGVHSKLWELWKLYLITGGLPEVIQQYGANRDNLLSALEAVRNKQLLLIAEYLKDMAKHAGAANALHVERVFRALPGQLARVQDDSVKRFRFSGVVPGISQYSRLVSSFDWLQGAGLVFKVPLIDSAQVPLGQHAKDNLFKLYAFDIGILGALSDIPPKQILDFDFGTYKGFLAENYVIQALKAQGLKSIYGWNEGTAEIEFVTSDLEHVIPIEVKAGSVRQAKSLNIFIKKYAPNRAYVFGATTPREDGVVRRRPIYSAGIGALGRV